IGNGREVERSVLGLAAVKALELSDQATEKAQQLSRRSRRNYRRRVKKQARKLENRVAATEKRRRWYCHLPGRGFTPRARPRTSQLKRPRRPTPSVPPSNNASRPRRHRSIRNQHDGLNWASCTRVKERAVAHALPSRSTNTSSRPPSDGLAGASGVGVCSGR